MELSTTECTMIARKAFKRDDVTVVSFGYSSASDAARGFIAVSNVLHIRVRVDGKIQILRFFVKLPPGNPFHSKMVRQTRAFYKESQFFLKIHPYLKKYLTGKIFPKCYFSNENVTVLEDLTAEGYTNSDSGILDRHHIEATLRSLAAYHASSFAAEIHGGFKFDEICPEILFISWYSHLPDHPGHLHLQTGIKALKSVFDEHFPHENNQIREKAIKLFQNLPTLLLPSTQYRNCLSHNDLWSNNIMFKYFKSNPEAPKIENACLIDMQLFGYNPPAHDVYTLIFLNTINSQSKNSIDDLVKFYYKAFSDSLAKFGLNSTEILSYENFKKSEFESVPLALGLAVLFTHFTTLPEQYLSEIVNNEGMLSKMMHQDRIELVLRSINNVPEYKHRLFAMINNLFEYLRGEWSTGCKSTV